MRISTQIVVLLCKKALPGFYGIPFDLLFGTSKAVPEQTGSA
jgi:hypothetical protein